MKSFFFALAFFLCLSCNSKTDDVYFYNINEEISAVVDNKKAVRDFVEKEYQKYKHTKDAKYLISSQYAKLFLHHYSQDNRQRPGNTLLQLPILFDIINLNKGQSDFISMQCYFSLSLSLEENSPDLAMKFIDRSIDFCEKMPVQYYIGHLYHAKGRFYFNQKIYDKALVYFKKAILNYTDEEYLYRASMYNNFALVNEKSGEYRMAITNTGNAIKILESRNGLTSADKNFLSDLKINLAGYFISIKNYRAAESILKDELEILKNANNAKNQLSVLKKLFFLYSTTFQDENVDKIVRQISVLNKKTLSTEEHLSATKLLFSYFLQKGQLSSIKELSEKLADLNEKFDNENLANLKSINNQINSYVIADLEKKSDFQNIQERNRNILIIIFAAVIACILGFYINAKKRNIRKLRKIAEQNKEIFEKDKEILQQNLEIQNQKIQNLHHNLTLKIQTEKAFLEKLRKAKKSKDASAEVIIKDMLFQVNNLIKIDNSNYATITENDKETIRFTEKLSAAFPGLTPKELKLCLYFRMELSTKEISILLNSTDGSIRVYKTKIKTKMNLSREDHLANFLQSI